MSTHSPANPVLEQFEQLLRDAAAKLRTASVRSAFFQSLEISAGVLVVTSLAAVGTCLAGLPRSTSAEIEIGGVFAGMVTMLFRCARAHFSPHDFSRIAERLDLAAGNRNAISAGLEFARIGEPSPFALQAIDDGLAAARLSRATNPVTPPIRIDKLRLVSLLLISVGLLVISWLTGIQSIGRNPLAVDHHAGSPFAVAFSPAIAETPPRNTQARLESSNQSGDPSNADHSAGSKSPRTGQSTNPSIAAGSGTSQSTKSAKAASSTSHPNPADSAAAQPTVSTPRLASAKESVGDAIAEVSPGSPSPSGNADAFSESAAGQQHDAPDLATQSGDKTGGDSQSPAGDNQKSQSKKSGASPQDSANSKENQATKKGGSAGANSSQDGMNGNGKQPGGGNAPKKSRGVAPLMLGSRQADLFEGKKLPGTDERTEMPAPPQASPESPAAAADTNSRTGDELPVSPYLVPADMQQVVSDYFHQFHSDTEPK